MKICIGSLQYSPIYKSHCCALGEQCEKYGHSVRYLFSYNYEWMLSEEQKEKTIFIGNSKDIASAVADGLKFSKKKKIIEFFKKENPEYIYMYNYHPFLNYQIAKLSKKFNITYIQHIHEPYVENKKVYGGLTQYWLYLFEYAQEKLLEETDIAIISSKRALNLFEKRYPNFSGKKLLIPLMYEDLGNSIINIEDRKYITFIGPPVTAKGPETFLKIIDYSEKNNLNYIFILISRSKIKDPRYYNRSNLRIFHKKKISDEEMGEYIKHSIMTITPYKVATQSSVILTSYMHGTPVISNKIGGLTEVVNHLKTGYLLSDNEPVENWIAGIDFIIANLSILSKNCRDYFLREFSEVNWQRYFKDMWVRNNE